MDQAYKANETQAHVENVKNERKQVPKRKWAFLLNSQLSQHPLTKSWAFQIQIPVNTGKENAFLE